MNEVNEELWTRLVLASSGFGPVEVWTKQPVEAVSDAIQKRHPIMIASGEYIHPDNVARFYSYGLWRQKQDEREKRRQEWLAEKAEKEKLVKKPWFKRLLGA